MHKTLAGLALVAALLASAPAFADVSVDVNGRTVAFEQPPVMQDGRVLVPLRGVFEDLGATVVYYAQTRSIMAHSQNGDVTLELGSTSATVNGQSQPLDVPPMLVRGRAMVPLRFVSQALGAGVTWDAETETVSINGPMPMTSESYPAPSIHPAPTIARIVLDDGHLPDRPLRPGEVLGVRMYGTAGGVATLEIQGVSIPMEEGPAGTYTTDYTVRGVDMGSNASVSVNLAMPDGEEASRSSDQMVAMGGSYARPEVQHRLIRSVVHDGNGTLAMGQILEVAMLALPGCEATFDVGPHIGLPMEEVSPGTYVGRFRVPVGDVDMHAQVVAHLQTETGESASLLAPTTVSWFGIPR